MINSTSDLNTYVDYYNTLTAQINGMTANDLHNASIGDVLTFSTRNAVGEMMMKKFNLELWELVELTA